MQTRTLFGTVAVLAVTLAVTGLADEKLDAVEKQIGAKWKKIDSMTAKMEMNATGEMQGMKITQTMSADVSYLRKGDELLSRMEGKMVQKVGDGGMEMEIPMLTVSNAEITYTVFEQMGQKMCVKADANSQSLAGAEMLKSLHEEGEVTLGDDAKINEKDCWVINFKPKDAGSQPGQPVKMVIYFRQSDGVTVQINGFDVSDKQMMTMTFSEIKLNEKIDPDLFKFEPPEGVPVIDNTNKDE